MTQPEATPELRPASARPFEAAAGRAAVAGILLAAGTSSRMGGNKLLLELEGETLLRRAARRALDGGLSPVLVVLGHEAEKARRELADLPVSTVFNASALRTMRTRPAPIFSPTACPVTSGSPASPFKR